MKPSSVLEPPRSAPTALNAAIVTPARQHEKASTPSSRMATPSGWPPACAASATPSSPTSPAGALLPLSSRASPVAMSTAPSSSPAGAATKTCGERRSHAAPHSSGLTMPSTVGATVRHEYAKGVMPSASMTGSLGTSDSFDACAPIAMPTASATVEHASQREDEGEAQHADGGARALGSEVSLNSSYLVVLCGTSSWTVVRPMWLAARPAEVPRRWTQVLAPFDLAPEKRSTEHGARHPRL